MDAGGSDERVGSAEGRRVCSSVDFVFCFLFVCLSVSALVTSLLFFFKERGDLLVHCHDSFLFFLLSTSPQQVQDAALAQRPIFVEAVEGEEEEEKEVVWG